MNDVQFGTPRATHRWGFITWLGDRRVPLYAENPKGEPYVIDTQGLVYTRFRCACGHEWEILKADFPGRRALRSCGRPECPHTPRPKLRRPPGQQGSSTTFYLSNDLQQQVREMATRRKVSYSRVLEDIVRQFFVDRFINE